MPLYRSFKAIPVAFFDKKTGEELPYDEEMKALANDVQKVSDLAYWEITEENLRALAHDTRKGAPSGIGWRLGIKLPDWIQLDGKSGRSRLEQLVRDRAVRELLSWSERRSPSGYVSAGWKRTRNGAKPASLSPKYSLSSVNRDYVRLEQSGDSILLELVINGHWRVVVFDFDSNRFHGFSKICLPDVILTKKAKHPRFLFSVEYPEQKTSLSSRYVVGVDVGVNKYATVTVYDRQEEKIAYSTTLSQRVNSLANKVRKANVQVRSLQKQGRADEAALHRAANSRRKRQLAILAAQEISDLAFRYDNAAVVFEDLGFVSNTMQHGRWNRGELVKRTEEYVRLNGSFVYTVNPSNTSQNCWQCGGKVAHPQWKVSVCNSCNIVMDRDENAAVNIAIRAIAPIDKTNKTLRKSKLFRESSAQRSNVHSSPLKYPGRDRTKNKPTPKRKKEVKTFVITQRSARGKDDHSVAFESALTGVLVDCKKHLNITMNTRNMKPLADFMEREMRMNRSVFKE